MRARNKPDLTGFKFLFWAAIGLLVALDIYLSVWVFWIIKIVVNPSPLQAFGIDVYNAVTSLNALDYALFTSMAVWMYVTLGLTLLRSRLSLYTHAAAIVSHVTLWLRLLGNPYYSGDLGVLILPMEFLILTLLVLLLRAGRLR
jgi:hypothetical protein